MNEEILKKLEHIESDLISDRTKIDDLMIKMSTLDERIKNLYERLPRMEDKQKDATAEVVQPVIDAVDNLNKTIKKKKMITRQIVINPITEFFKRLKGGEKK